MNKDAMPSKPSLKEAVRLHKEKVAAGLLSPKPNKAPKKPKATPEPTQAPQSPVEAILDEPLPPKLFRLPDHSSFNATYDAQQKKWEGTLTVGEKTWKAKKTGIHYLFSFLGRKWFQEKEKNDI